MNHHTDEDAEYEEDRVDHNDESAESAGQSYVDPRVAARFEEAPLDATQVAGIVTTLGLEGILDPRPNWRFIARARRFAARLATIVGIPPDPGILVCREYLKLEAGLRVAHIEKALAEVEESVIDDLRERILRQLMPPEPKGLEWIDVRCWDELGRDLRGRPPREQDAALGLLCHYLEGQDAGMEDAATEAGPPLGPIA